MSVLTGSAGLATILYASLFLTTEDFIRFSLAWGGFSLAAFVLEWTVKNTLLSHSFGKSAFKRSITLAITGGTLLLSLLALGLINGNLGFVPVLSPLVFGAGIISFLLSRIVTLHLHARRKWGVVGGFSFFEALIRFLILAAMAHFGLALTELAIPISATLSAVLAAALFCTPDGKPFKLSLRLDFGEWFSGIAPTLLIAVFGVGFTFFLGSVFQGNLSIDQSLIDSYMIFRPSTILVLTSLQVPLLLFLENKKGGGRFADLALVVLFIPLGIVAHLFIEYCLAVGLSLLRGQEVFVQLQLVDLSLGIFAAILVANGLLQRNQDFFIGTVSGIAIFAVVLVAFLGEEIIATVNINPANVLGIISFWIPTAYLVAVLVRLLCKPKDRVFK